MLTPMSSKTFPLLCNCKNSDGIVEHRSKCSTYVLWVLPDGKHITFIHEHILANRLVNKGQTFGELLMSKPSHEEPCKMISRPFLQTIGFKPDYVVVVQNANFKNNDSKQSCSMSSGYSMSTFLRECAKNPTMEHIVSLAEGPGDPCGPRNQIGQLITQLSSRLASKGFFSDPKYFPHALRDMQCLASGMSLNELRLRKLFKRI